jgi:hypothetical protein
MLKQAFKEWAAVCLALAEGRQSLLLRKGGIAETSVDFRPEHNRFWLYPTYTHQQAKALLPDAAPLLAQSESERPRSGVVRLSHFAEVSGVYHVHDLVPVLMLGHMHIWSEETVRARFAYRRPGIYVLAVRVYRAPQVHEVAETETYAGCRTWVELEQALPTRGALPVMEDEAFHDLLRSLDTILNPTAFA